MIRYRTYAALSGASVRKDGKVGCREIICDFRILYISEIHEYPLLSLCREGFYDLVISFKGAVWFPGYYELIIFRQEPECLKEDVEAFVFPDETEEKQILLSWLEPELLLCFFSALLFSEMRVKRMLDHGKS